MLCQCRRLGLVVMFRVLLYVRDNVGDCEVFSLQLAHWKMGHVRYMDLQEIKKQ